MMWFVRDTGSRVGNRWHHYNNAGFWMMKEMGSGQSNVTTVVFSVAWTPGFVCPACLSEYNNESRKLSASSRYPNHGKSPSYGKPTIYERCLSVGPVLPFFSRRWGHVSRNNPAPNPRVHKDRCKEETENLSLILLAMKDDLSCRILAEI